MTTLPWRCLSFHRTETDLRAGTGSQDAPNRRSSRLPIPGSQPMDTVFIEALRIDALIGMYDWERRARQPVVLDLEMAFDNTRAAASDAIADTLDYKAVSKRLIKFVSESDFQLVETLAERCAELVQSEFNVAWLRLKLAKPGAVRGSRAVGVIIERGTRPD